jgi:acyl-ACP thioesterase
VPWRFRRADLDQFGHVNNAAQFAVVEEHLTGDDRAGDVEIEYLSPTHAGVELTVVIAARATDGARTAWLVAPDGSRLTVFRRRSAGHAQPSSSGIGGS